jgi:hypothetical protein
MWRFCIIFRQFYRYFETPEENTFREKCHFSEFLDFRGGQSLESPTCFAPLYRRVNQRVLRAFKTLTADVLNTLISLFNYVMIQASKNEEKLI